MALPHRHNSEITNPDDLDCTTTMSTEDNTRVADPHLLRIATPSDHHNTHDMWNPCNPPDIVSEQRQPTHFHQTRSSTLAHRQTVAPSTIHKQGLSDPVNPQNQPTYYDQPHHPAMTRQNQRQPSLNSQARHQTASSNQIFQALVMHEQKGLSSPNAQGLSYPTDPQHPTTAHESQLIVQEKQRFSPPRTYQLQRQLSPNDAGHRLFMHPTTQHHFHPPSSNHQIHSTTWSQVSKQPPASPLLPHQFSDMISNKNVNVLCTNSTHSNEADRLNNSHSPLNNQCARPVTTTYPIANCSDFQAHLPPSTAHGELRSPCTVTTDSESSHVRDTVSHNLPYSIGRCHPPTSALSQSQGSHNLTGPSNPPPSSNPSFQQCRTDQSYRINGSNVSTSSSQGTTSQNQTRSKSSMGSPESAIPKLENKLKQVQAMIEKFPVSLVCGAPMVGKSTVVCQALDTVFQAPGDRAPIHIMCKECYTFACILRKLAENFKLDITELNQFNASRSIYNCVSKNGLVTFVFHKCETLREIDQMKFLNFLLDLHNVSQGLVRSVVTTYSQFATPRISSIHQIQMGMMDNDDIRNFIRFYVGAELSDNEGYVQMIIRNNLCFPLAVRYVIEEYLLQNGHRDDIPSAGDIDRKIKTSPFQFLSKLLHHRVKEVETWVSASKRKWMALFCLSHDATTSEELLRQMVRSDGDDYGTESMEWNDLMKTFAVIRVPGLDRLQFHPLLVYYFMLELDKRIALEGMWFDISCSKVVKFLCHTLCMADEMSQFAGYKSVVFQCVLPEWPTMKNIIQMAIHCNRHTYKDFYKVAMVGCHLMVKWSTQPSIQFFQSLYEYAYQAAGYGRTTNGYRRQAAILEGMMAHAIHVASGNSQKVGDWDRTNDHFKSALRVLQDDGASFYLAQLYSMYGRALSYQGEYQMALRYLGTGRDMLKFESEKALLEEREGHLAVSEGRLEDMRRRLDVNLAMPLIFTGRNDEAKEILYHSVEEMEKTGLDHATKDFVFNLLGLATQRGGGDKKEALKLYKASLKERMDLEMFCPNQMVVPLNNIGMLYLDFGQTGQAMSMLEKALDIQRKTNRWNKYYTALTLLHKSEVCMKSDDLHQALDDALEAKKVLDIVSNKHDLHWHVQNQLGHIRMALDQEKRTFLARISSMSQNGFQGPGNIGFGSNPELQRICSSLAKSDKAETYFERVLGLGEEYREDMSDNSNLYVLAALRHLVILNLGRPEKMEHYLDVMGRVFDTYPWMINEFNKPVDKMNCKMKDNLEFHQKANQVLNQNNPRLVSDSDFNILHGLVTKNCYACKRSPKYFDCAAWLTKYYNSMAEQQRRRHSDQNRIIPYVIAPSPIVTDQEESGPSQNSAQRSQITPAVTSQGTPTFRPQYGPAVASHDARVFTPQNVSTATSQSPSTFRPREASTLVSQNALAPQNISNWIPPTAQISRSNNDPAPIRPQGTLLANRQASEPSKAEDFQPQSPIVRPHYPSSTSKVVASTENSPADLKSKHLIDTVTVYFQTEEESSDRKCHSSTKSDDLNQTYAQVAESDVEFSQTANDDTIKVLPDLQRHWRNTYLTYTSPDSSDSSIQNHQNEPIVNPRTPTESAFIRGVDESQVQDVNAGLMVASEATDRWKIEAGGWSRTDPEDLVENIKRTYQKSQNLYSNTVKNQPHSDFGHVDEMFGEKLQSPPVVHNACSNRHNSSHPVQSSLQIPHGGARPKIMNDIAQSTNQVVNTNRSNLKASPQVPTESVFYSGVVGMGNRDLPQPSISSNDLNAQTLRTCITELCKDTASILTSNEPQTWYHPESTANHQQQVDRNQRNPIQNAITNDLPRNIIPDMPQNTPNFTLHLGSVGDHVSLISPPSDASTASNRMPVQSEDEVDGFVDLAMVRYSRQSSSSCNNRIQNLQDLCQFEQFPDPKRKSAESGYDSSVDTNTLNDSISNLQLEDAGVGALVPSIYACRMAANDVTGSSVRGSEEGSDAESVSEREGDAATVHSDNIVVDELSRRNDPVEHDERDSQ